MAQGRTCPLAHFVCLSTETGLNVISGSFPDGWTYCLILHAREDDVEHLRERGLGRGLVDEVLAGQVDVVTRADGLQHSTLVDFYVLGSHRCQQSLEDRREDKRCPSGRDGLKNVQILKY